MGTEKQAQDQHDDDMLDSFDHVVVLMFENRSFDNILGYMYPHGVPDDAPAGKTFEGVAGKHLSNPIPEDTKHKPKSGQMEIPVSPIVRNDSHQPYPDPGEDYVHVNTQLFNRIDGGNRPPYNLPDPVPERPGMQGFVRDYIENYKTTERPGVDPSYEEYAAIMQCFDPVAVPVITALAEQFAVFDHWFCSVPSQTWCNRAFWHAGTSWGHVVNGGTLDDNSKGWFEDSAGSTIFNQIEDAKAGLNWKIYSSNEASLTGIIHARALEDFHDPEHFPTLEQFFEDCEKGALPSYAFLEPNFWTPHNDMHPSSYDSCMYGPSQTGSVLLGEHLLWRVYNAVRNAKSESGSNWKNTLLIITFDEHGGCYDHVPPPPKVTPPDLSSYKKWDGFGFDRLGVRVPTIMVSAHIAKHTVINTEISHDAFLKTMQRKWNRVAPGSFPTLTARQRDAQEFTEVFTASACRDRSDWPEIPEPAIPRGESGFPHAPLNHLQKSILNSVAVRANEGDHSHKARKMETQLEAIELIRSLSGHAGANPSASQLSGCRICRNIICMIKRWFKRLWNAIKSVFT